LRAIPEKHQATYLANLQDGNSRQVPFVDPHYYDVESWFQGDKRVPRRSMLAKQFHASQVFGLGPGFQANQNVYSVPDGGVLHKPENSAFPTGFVDTGYENKDNVFQGLSGMAQGYIFHTNPVQADTHHAIVQNEQDYAYHPTSAKQGTNVHQPIAEASQKEKEKENPTPDIPETFTREQVVQLMTSMSNMNIRDHMDDKNELIKTLLNNPQTTGSFVCFDLPLKYNMLLTSIGPTG